jgi:P27 family predicted phage terminase small subunit
MLDIAPPRPLDAAAAVIYERHARRLLKEGRLPGADLEMLALFAETMVVYIALRDDITLRGVVVAGRDGNVVKNPSLSGLQSARVDLRHLSAAVPLYSGVVDRSELDRQIDEILQGDK